jgi:hypothetical protein
MICGYLGKNLTNKDLSVQKEEKNTPVLLIGLTIILLILLSFIPKDTRIAGSKIKPVDLFMDVKPDSLL